MYRALRKCNLLNDADQRKREKLKQKKNRLKSKSKTNITHAINVFFKKVREGPVFICCSCQKLLYKRSVSEFKRDLFKECDDSFLHSCTNDKATFDQKQYICSTCSRHFKQNSIPPESIGNNLKLEDIPDELRDLSFKFRGYTYK